MRSPLVLLSVSTAIIHQSMAFTYWLDASCTGRKMMNTVVTDTINLAEAAHRRLNSGSDTDFQHVYETLMKRTKDTNDATFKAISGFMDDVSKMTPQANRNAANVRIYCDNAETRWVERKDPKTGRNLGGWEDKDNWILYPHVQRPGCLLTKGGKKTTYGETFKTYMEGDSPETQADVRATISLCDLLFLDGNGAELDKNLVLTGDGSLKATVDLTNPRFHLDWFGGHASKTLLHELSHTEPYNTIDHDGTYCWNIRDPDICRQRIQDLDPKGRETLADVRAILGQMAQIADRGFTFHRKPREDANDKEKKDYEKDIEQGKFHKYDNISKRALRRRMQRHARRYGK